MRTLKSSREAAPIALRSSKPIPDHPFISYILRDARSSDETELSWDDFPDDQWPDDFWVVGAAVDPALWLEVWTFLDLVQEADHVERP